MLLNLILKDIRVYKKIFLFRIMIPMAVLSNIFTLRFFSWDVYFMFGCMLVAVAGSVFIMFEKSGYGEALGCSLPSTRSAVVFAKYLTSAFFAGIGILVLLLNAYVADFIHPRGPADFEHFFNLKVLFMTLFFYFIYKSIFFPAALHLKPFGGFIALVLAQIVAVSAIAIFFRPGWGSYTPYFNTEDLLGAVVLNLLVLLLFGSSALLALQLYKKKDI